MANVENEFQLTGYEFGKYRVLSESNEVAISNIHGEFWVVPDKSIPVLSPEHDSVPLGDSIRVSMSRDGTICLLSPVFFKLDTFHIVSEIIKSPKLLESADAFADSEVSFSTDVYRLIIFGFMVLTSME